MNAGIYFNKNYLTENKSYLERIENSLLAGGNGCIIVNRYSDLKGLDVLFVLGGDGTILNVAADCARNGVKIIGINYGHLGFLTEYEPEKVDDAIRLVCEGNYSVQKRAMLEVECGKNKFYALNDLVIQRSTGGHDFTNTVELRALIDGTIVDNYLSDGIIVSTPTGSTAYSLSAGGSILTPDINAFIMTPICAHSLHSKPVVYNDNSVLEIIPLNYKTPLNVVVDGRIVEVIKNPVTIKIKKSDYFAEFITGNENNFFNKLLIKLNIWSK